MRSIEEVWNGLSDRSRGRIAVAAAADAPVLCACADACARGIAECILVGDAQKIKWIADEHALSLKNCTVIDEKEEEKAARTAVALVADGKADVIMKGLIHSGTFLKACLRRDGGIRKQGSLLSAIAVVEAPGMDRLLLITDLAVNPDPDLAKKKMILANAVDAAHKLGIEMPKAAIISGSETVNEKVVSSYDGMLLQKACETGEISGCIVEGPVSLDIAVSAEAAAHKGYTGAVGGQADILLMPDVDAGNVLYKSLVCFSQITTGGIMCGAAAPIVFCSRADSAETKLNTIALAVYLAGKENV